MPIFADLSKYAEEGKLKNRILAVSPSITKGEEYWQSCLRVAEETGRTLEDVTGECKRNLALGRPPFGQP